MAALTQTISANVNSDGVTFSFNQFNPALGTLNSVTFAILSSVDSNYFSVMNGNNSSIVVESPRDYLSVYDNQGSNSNYYGNDVPLVTTPVTVPVGYTLAGNTSQNFSLIPKSLIGSNAVITDLTSYSNLYTGTGNVTFDVVIAPNVTISGGLPTFDMSTVTNTTTLQLTYTYSTKVARLLSNGVYFTNTYFDEVTYTSNKVATTAMYSREFDEVTINGGNIAKRETNNGKVLISGYFDEVSGIV